MGLTDVLARAAVRRSHVLVIEVRGRWRTRVAVERAVASRGWLLALSPADADVVAVCGHPGPQLAEAVERVWHEMPGPRVRVDVADEAEVASRLDEARTALLDTPRHHDDARTRPFAADLIASNSADTDDEASSGDGDDGTADEGSGEDNGQGGGCDQGQHDGHQGHDAHGDMDHGDMDHGDMEMAPGGIPLAGGAEDRDGLEMDVLEVPLGPVLPHWPPGLVLNATLHGDVVAQARGELLDEPVGGDAPTDTLTALPGEGVAYRLDAAASLLALAGWEAGAARVRSLRDVALDGADESDLAGRLNRLRRQVARSRVLRWSLRGLRPVTDDDLRTLGLPADTAGDTYDRVLRLLEPLDGVGRTPPADVTSTPDPAVVGASGRREDDQLLRVDAITHLVTGLDVATARLVVASLNVRRLQGSRESEESHV